MNASWPEVPLGSVLKRVARFEERDELTEYQFAGTYSFARGIFVAERKLGSTFKLSKVQRIHEGDFVYCKIMAWEGAFGIAPKEAHNCVMSGAFVAYEVDQNQIDPQYLDYYFKIERVWKSVGRQSTGTNVRRRSLHPNQFEAATIPLSPLDEQRRIVARIEELAALIEEAQGLRVKARGEAGTLLQAALNDIFSRTDHTGWEFVELGQIVEQTQTRNPTKCPEKEFVYVDISSVDKYKGVIRESKKYLGRDAPSRARRVIQAGDVIFAMTRPYLKGIALVPEELDNQICSTGFCVLRSRRGRVGPRWLLHTCRSDHVVGQVTTKMRGSNYPAVSDKDVKSAEVPLPPLDEQRRSVAYLDGLQAQVDELTALQDATQVELDALLPSVLDRAFRGEL